MDIQKDLTEEIVIEIAFAIRKLGGEPGALNLTDAWAVNRLLEFLGADIYLMATVGSWRDALPDDEVLADLRKWNRGESLRPETSFVKRLYHGRATLIPKSLGKLTVFQTSSSAR